MRPLKEKKRKKRNVTWKMLNKQFAAIHSTLSGQRAVQHGGRRGKPAGPQGRSLRDSPLDAGPCVRGRTLRYEQERVACKFTSSPLFDLRFKTPH